MSPTPTNLSNNPIHILLVEDDDGDAKAVQRAFSKAKIANPIIRYEDGLQALESLKGANGAEKPPTPYILLIDLNMPRMDGIELVENIRQDSELKKDVIFILTTSKSDEDKNKAYDQNIAGYILKETAGRDFLKLVEMIDSYWRVVELPNT